MTNSLTVLENEQISKVSVQLQPFIKAKFGTPINKIGVDSLYFMTLDLIQTTLIESGVKDQADKTVINFLTTTIHRDVQGAKFNHLSFEDIKLSLHLGVRKEYGDYMGVNIQTIHSWIKSYLKDKNRELAVLEFNKSIPTSEKPIVYTNEFYIKAAKSAFEDYKNNGIMPISGACAGIYDRIKDKLKVKTLIKKEDWQKVLNEAKEAYSLKMNPPKIGKKETVKLDFDISNRSLEFEVKKIGLKYYFDELIKINGSLPI